MAENIGIFMKNALIAALTITSRMLYMVNTYCGNGWIVCRHLCQPIRVKKDVLFEWQRKNAAIMGV